MSSEKLDSPVKLQKLVELTMLLRKAVEQQGRTVDVSGKLADLLSRYAALLASQGNLTAALTYLQNSQDVSVLTPWYIIPLNGLGCLVMRASLSNLIYRPCGKKNTDIQITQKTGNERGISYRKN